MRITVYLQRKRLGGAKEIDDAICDHMLAAKFEAELLPGKVTPKNHLKWRGVVTHGRRIFKQSRVLRHSPPQPLP
ncbi:hypothetical protein [Sphingobium limneticum]|uniref:hypothetical protein n=1 Tax=Sphingobium limneticum TaxID=1007511 RepID=UPI001FEA5DCE|nr:hypothetical protein [Sphingobium limneticum]